MVQPSSDSVNQLLREAASGELQSWDRLLKETCQQACAEAGYPRVLEVYQTMAAHLNQVGSGTDFWVWFRQISGSPRLARVQAATAPPNLLELLQQSALPSSSALPLSVGERVARFALEGHLIFAGSSLFLLVGVAATDPVFGLGMLVVGLSTGTLLGSLLGFWRRRLFAPGFLPASLLAVVVLQALLVAGAFAGAGWIGLVPAGAALGFYQPFFPFLERAFDNLSTTWLIIFLSLGMPSGLFGAFLARRLVGNFPWVQCREITQVFRNLCFLPWLGLLPWLMLGSFLWTYRDLSPDLVDRFHIASPAQLKAYLPKGLEKASNGELEEYWRGWTLEARKVWPDRHTEHGRWTARALLSVAERVENPLSEPDQIEAEIRCLILGKTYTAPDRLGKAQISPEGWRAWRDLVHDGYDRRREVAVQELAWEAFANEWLFHDRPLEPLCVKALRRAVLEEEWKAFLAGESPPSSRRSKEFKEYTDYPFDSVESAVSQQERLNSALAGLLLFLELKRMQAAGEPKPQGLDAVALKISETVRRHQQTLDLSFHHNGIHIGTTLGGFFVSWPDLDEQAVGER